MSSNEIWVSLVGAFIGYWIIHTFVGAGKRPNGGQATAIDEPYTQATPSSGEPTRPWHVVLGVTPTASLDEVEAAYHALLQQYHPDKVVDLGLDLRELAEAKSKEIAKAYEDARATLDAHE